MTPPRTLASRYLFADLEDAVTLGSAGWVAEGYAVLDVGLAATEARPEGPWAPMLLERYRRAVVCYQATYGLPALPEPDLFALRMLTLRIEHG